MFGMILVGLRNFGGGGLTPKPPPVRHCCTKLGPRYFLPGSIRVRGNWFSAVCEQAKKSLTLRLRFGHFFVFTTR